MFRKKRLQREQARLQKTTKNKRNRFQKSSQEQLKIIWGYSETVTKVAVLLLKYIKGLFL